MREYLVMVESNCNYQGWYATIASKAEKVSGCFVEIGAYHGASTVAMASALKQLHYFTGKKIRFYTIDNFISGKENLPGEESFYETFLKTLRYFNVEDYVTVIRGDSKDPNVINMFEDKSIAMLYIDGDHRYEGVKADILNYLPKMSESQGWGIISGHDWQGKYVQDAVFDTLGGPSEVAFRNTWVKYLNPSNQMTAQNYY